MARPTYGQPNGVRLNPKQDVRCRSAIQTTALLKRLNAFALDWPDPGSGRPFEMSDTQVRAALGLLRKTIPDLAVTTHTGTGPDGAIHYTFSWQPQHQVIGDTPQPLTISIEASDSND